MTKPIFDLSILTELPRSTLSQIMGRVRALIAFTSPVDNSVESVDNYEWLVTGILRELQSRGLNGRIPMRVMLGLREYKNHFAPVAPSMDKWLRSLIHDDAERVELLVLSRLAAQCLAERISNKFHAPVCLSTMLRFYVQVPDAIEENFPGYCRNGWVPLLLSRRPKF